MRTRLTIAVALGLALVGSVLSPAPAAAQGFGIKFGFNDAIFKVTPNDPGNLAKQRGTVIGFYGPLRVKPVFGIQTEVLYSVEGTKFSNISGAFVRLTYFRIPILARIKVTGSLPVRVHVMVGPSIAVMFKVESNDGFGGAPLSKSDFKTYDVGLAYGGDVEVNHFVVDARYTRGLIDINKTAVNGQKTTNNMLTIMFGIRFRAS